MECSDCSASKIFLKRETFLARFTSSTKVSGQTFFISSSLSITCPPCSTNTNNVSKAFGVSGMWCSSRRSRRSVASRRKGPNSYKWRSVWLIGRGRYNSEIVRLTRSPKLYQNFTKSSERFFLPDRLLYVAESYKKTLFVTRRSGSHLRRIRVLI